MEIADSLGRLGIPTTDTRDADGRHRFLGIGIDSERMSTRKDMPDFWLWRYSPDAREGKQCCSTRFVASHYAWPDQMRYLDDAHEAGCEGRGHESY